MPKLTDLDVTEVSFCKKGMNQHARVALFKSADETPAEIAKATFAQALVAQQVSDMIYNACDGGWDSIWERKRAFQTALSDEISNGGDGSQAGADFTASITMFATNVVSAVQAALNAAGGDDTAEVVQKAMDDAADKFLAESSQQKGKKKMPKITNKAELLSAVSKFDPTTGTVADVQAIHKAAADLNADDALPASGPLAKAQDHSVLLRKVAVLEMPADIRKHFDALPAAEQDGFITKSEAERADIVAKANLGDPVVFTTSDGIEIRKSDGRTAELLARQNDKLAKSVEELTKAQTATSLDSRAAAYGNVAKATAVRLLKSVDTLGADTPEGKDVLSTLETMNKARTGLFKGLGTSDGGGEGGGVGSVEKAQVDFDTAVEQIAKRDNIPMADAMKKARVEKADLFREAFPEDAEMNDRVFSD